MKSLLLLVSLICAMPMASYATLIFGDAYWASVGDTGNAAHVGSPTYGAVSYDYQIAKTEITNSQYVSFLNAVAASDPYGLYNTSMGSANQGGIIRAGSDGSYTYSVRMTIYDYTARAVSLVSVYDVMRYANWLNNGATGGAGTETGAYTLLGGTATPTNAATIARTGGATYYVPTLDEWYKAAFYKGGGTDAGYWGYATASDTQPTASVPSATANTANYANAAGNPDIMPVGSYTNSTSAYGTFDQNGNVYEWTEFHAAASSNYGALGGSYGSGGVILASTRSAGFDPGSFEHASQGFRLVAIVPEPSALALASLGLGLVLFRRKRRIGWIPTEWEHFS